MKQSFREIRKYADRDSKVCSKCKKKLPIDEFYKQTGGKIKPRCKSCYCEDKKERAKARRVQRDD